MGKRFDKLTMLGGFDGLVDFNVEASKESLGLVAGERRKLFMVRKISAPHESGGEKIPGLGAVTDGSCDPVLFSYQESQGDCFSLTVSSDERHTFYKDDEDLGSPFTDRLLEELGKIGVSGVAKFSVPLEESVDVDGWLMLSSFSESGFGTGHPEFRKMMGEKTEMLSGKLVVMSSRVDMIERSGEFRDSNSWGDVEERTRSFAALFSERGVLFFSLTEDADPLRETDEVRRTEILRVGDSILVSRETLLDEDVTYPMGLQSLANRIVSSMPKRGEKTVSVAGTPCSVSDFSFEVFVRDAECLFSAGCPKVFEDEEAEAMSMMEAAYLSAVLPANTGRRKLVDP